MSPVLVVVFAIAASVLAVIAVGSARRRHEAPAAGALSLVAASISFWSVCEIVALLPAPMGLAIGAKTALYLGVAGAVAGFYCLSRAVVDRGWRLTRRTATLLAIEPVLLAAAVATNPWHHEFVQRWTEVDGPFTRVQETYGVLFWVHAAYSNLLLAVGIARLIRAAWRGEGPVRRMYQSIVMGTVAPVVANFLAVTGITGSANLTVIGFTVTACFSYRAVFGHWLTRHVPVANQRILDTVGDAVAVVDRTGVIITTNPAADRLVAHLSGASGTSLHGRALIDVLPGIRLQDDADVEREHTLLDVGASGRDLHIRVCVLHDHRRRHIGWTLVARDVTELQRQRAALEHANASLEGANRRLSTQLETIEALRADLAEQAVRDPLTGLHNRRHVMSRIEALAAQMLPTSALSIGLVDVDHFKRVNDEHGHGVGDTVLVQLAAMLHEGAGPDDVVGRHGGEEFVLLMPDADEEAAARRLDAIRERVAAALIDADGQPLSITISAGVATVRGQFQHPVLFHAADQALYRAKDGGRNLVMTASAAV